MNHRGLLVVVSGFSGVGKGTLVKKLVTECDNYALSVSMTTRKPRKGEIDGVSYFFVDHDMLGKTLCVEHTTPEEYTRVMAPPPKTKESPER